MAPDCRLIQDETSLQEIATRAERSPRIAVDVEGNGLFVYRARLCTVQLAWLENDSVHIAVVDAIRLGLGGLSRILGSRGPTKVLHDLTFDAKMLAEVGLALDNVVDTSVMARLLGRKATGLASLLQSELGISLSKHLQQHDWSRRPLTPEHLAYLCNDVAHLDALARKLEEEIAATGIHDEVREECAFKLETSLLPPRERRAPHLRIRGVEKLQASERARLRLFCAAREQLAEELDVPPYRFANNDLLLDLACRKGTLSELRASPPSRHREAVVRILDRAASLPVPEEEVPPKAPDRAVLAATRGRQKRLTAWRQAEALARGVDEQVVLPGHCLSALAELDAPTESAMALVPGLGQARVARYGSALLEVLRGTD